MRWRYRAALTRRARGRLLDEYCQTTGCHRKAAVRRLAAQTGGARRRPGRPVRYGRELLPVLERLWLSSDQRSGKLLRPVLPALLRALQVHHGVVIAAPLVTALTTASAATRDRRLAPSGGGGAGSRTASRRPGRTSAPRCLWTWSQWRGVRPGALQGDLVLHCGETTQGRYCATLVAIDVATPWTELQPLWDRHHQRVTGAIEHLARHLPCPLREWHSDNGLEFINRCLLGWCQRHQVRFTRGRPYRKNDQAWVEQRNGRLVRRLVGYDRYSSRAALTVLHRLYALLRLPHNFFRPIHKLVNKRRLGSKVIKRYDAAQTPYQHVLAAGVLTAAQRRAQEEQLRTLDPIALARDIQLPRDLLWKLADTRSTRREATHG